MKRLLSYLKPHKWVMTLATVLVLFIIAVELYRPIIIGNAIDQYINGYYHPYVEADVSASDAVNWNGLVLSRSGRFLLFSSAHYSVCAAFQCPVRSIPYAHLITSFRATRSRSGS